MEEDELVREAEQRERKQNEATLLTEIRNLSHGLTTLSRPPLSDERPSSRNSNIEDVPSPQSPDQKTKDVDNIQDDR